MKKVVVSFTIIIFLIISCNKKYTKAENRLIYSLQSNKVDNLLLKVENKDSIIDYKYKSKDSIKNFGFRYYIEKDVLVGDGVFKFKGKKIFFRNKNYKIYGYSKNGLVSHPRFILFRKDYGIIANITYGAGFLFLKDTIVNENTSQLFSKIIEKL